MVSEEDDRCVDLSFCSLPRSWHSASCPGRRAKDRPYGTNRLIAIKVAPLGSWIRGGRDDGPGRRPVLEGRRSSGSGARRREPGGRRRHQLQHDRVNQDWHPTTRSRSRSIPTDPDHIVAGSNDYFYRFNNSTGARQAIVPTGFFTSFDGGATWIDGQIPMAVGNGAGDPSPAFDRQHDVVLMAQLENTGGQGGAFVAQGDVSVSRSTDGGVTWSEPVTVFQGHGHRHRPRQQGGLLRQGMDHGRQQPELAVSTAAPT